MNAQKNRMMDRHLYDRGIRDERVLEAFAQVPRERFVASGTEEHAYEDRPLPIAAGQTISQPYVVALSIVQLNLHKDDNVLEVGTGSGYAAALLSRLASRVVTIERIKELADSSRELLSRLNYHNVEVVHGDGTLGFPAEAPFDAICVAAAGSHVPEALKTQLRIGGTMVIPVGGKSNQQLLKIVKRDDNIFDEQVLIPVRFVPLIGKGSQRFEKRSSKANAAGRQSGPS